jgi:hypothetical protein
VKFLILGHEFRFKRNDFKGPVVLSEDAFYFVIAKHGLADGVGLLGKALVALNERAGTRAANTCYTNDLANLPPEIVDDPQWPIRQTTGSVVVIPRTAVQSIRFPRFWLSNRLWVTAADLEVGTVFNIFRRQSIRRFLEQAGWDIGA